MCDIREEDLVKTYVFTDLDEVARNNFIRTYILPPLKDEARERVYRLFDVIEKASEGLLQIKLSDITDTRMSYLLDFKKDIVEPMGFAMFLVNNIAKHQKENLDDFNPDVGLFEVHLRDLIEQEKSNSKYNKNYSDSEFARTEEDFISDALLPFAKVACSYLTKVTMIRLESYIKGSRKNAKFLKDGTRTTDC